MKKFLLASALVLGISTGSVALTDTEINAQAKSYDMKPRLATALKQGTFPNEKGKVGMTYNTLAKKVSFGEMDFSGNILYFYPKKSYDGYTFDKKSFSGKSKVQSVKRSYDYFISKSSFKKYFGKPIKSANVGYGLGMYVYKAGKYYVSLELYSEDYYNTTFVIVGTKKHIMHEYNVYVHSTQM